LLTEKDALLSLIPALSIPLREVCDRSDSSNSHRDWWPTGLILLASTTFLRHRHQKQSAALFRPEHIFD
jgi:hypothetical protein